MKLLMVLLRTLLMMLPAVVLVLLVGVVVLWILRSRLLRLVLRLLRSLPIFLRVRLLMQRIADRPHNRELHPLYKPTCIQAKRDRKPRAYTAALNCRKDSKHMVNSRTVKIR
jgi:hypothetical protein